MPRRLRMAAGGYIYHVYNRAVGRTKLFRKAADYATFEEVLREAKDFQPIRLLAYCILPDRWHLLLWPRHDGVLSDYLRWVTVTHTQRYHARHRSTGTGPLYQGRFKCFPIQNNNHFLHICRYVERSPVQAGLVKKVEHWRWSSYWQRTQGDDADWLDAWPTPIPRNWLTQLRRSQKSGVVEDIMRSLLRGVPYGEPRWQKRTVKKLGLESTLRPRGRPRLTKSKRR